MNKYAILILDLQNEFFTHLGVLGKNHLDPLDLCPKIRSLIGISKKLDFDICWITSNYDWKEKPEIKRPAIPDDLK